MANQQQPAPGSSGGPPLVAQRYEVLPGIRLPQYDSPHAEAFQARDVRSSDQGYFALICRRGVLPRLDMIETVARSGRGALLRPVEWQVIDWPPAKAQCLAIVFPRPGGERVVARGKTKLEAWKADNVMRHVVQPLLPVLQEFSDVLVAHRAIRADNLFYANSGDGPVMLGECVSGPPGMAQDVIYESIGNGMAEPACRGAGGPPDDLYALGVLMIVLLTGEVPRTGMTAEEIVAAKLKFGSFGALVGKSHIPLTMTEPLRGLLCDDPKERWTVKDLEYWLGGRHLTPKQPSLPAKASRPYRFGDREFLDARSLAHAMANDWDKACEVLNGEEIMDWVRRSLGDGDAAGRIAETLRIAKYESSGGSRLQDQDVARILVVLDPSAPLRYRDLAVHPEALGRALAVKGHETEWFRRFDALMRSRLPLAWLDAQPSGQPDLTMLGKRLDETLRLYDQEAPGLGVERCLYTLEPSCPCKSGILERYYVVSASDLLPALERAAGQGLTQGDPVDRHIAAFCGTHIKELPEYFLSRLAQSDPLQQSLAATRLLAEIQRRTGAAQLPTLTGWLAERLRPLIGTFHHRPYRQDLETDLGRTVVRGVLGELCALLDDEAVRRADERGFHDATLEFKAASDEIAWLEQGGLTGRENVLQSSRQAASIVSSLCAGLLLVAITIVHWVH